MNDANGAPRRSLVVVPTYEEAGNIDELLRRLLALGVGLEVCVVDDGSPDGTAALARKVGAPSGRVHVIERPGKLGLGTAYAAGMTFALERGFERILTMDADFSHDPAAVPDLLRLAEEVDVAVGSRYVEGGRIENWGWGRRLLSRTANLAARLLLRVPLRDATAGFRCYRAEVLAAVDPESVRSNGYSWLEEMIWRIDRCGFRIGETPIVFVDRRAGRSKISRREIVHGVCTLLRLTFARAVPRRPGLPGSRSTAQSADARAEND